MELHYSYEPEILGTAGGLKKVEAFLRDETFVLINSDILIDLDLAALISFHRSRSSMVTLVLRKDPEAAKFGALQIDAAGRIRQLLRWTAPGDPLSPAELTETMFTGVHLVEPEVLAWIPSGRECSITHEVYSQMLEKGLPLYGYVNPGYWIDIGTPTRYLRAQWDLLEGKVPSWESAERQAPGAQEVWKAEEMGGPLAAPPGIWLGSGLRCGQGVRLRPPVLIGRDCHLQDGCVVGPFVVMGDGGSIGERTHLEQAILWEWVSVGGGCQVDSSILGPAVRIPEAMQFAGKVVVMDQGALKVTAIG